MPQKPIQNLLSQGKGPLGQIVAKVHALQKIQQLIQPLLAPELAKHCQVANFRHGCLVLQVESSAWATQLRYQIPTLLEKLRQPDKLPNVASIEFMVRKPSKTPD